MTRYELNRLLAMLLALSVLGGQRPAFAQATPTVSATPGAPLSCDLGATFPGIECRELALRAALDGMTATGSVRPAFHALLVRQLTRIQFQTAKAERLITQRQRARGRSWLGAAHADTISFEHRLDTTGTRALSIGNQRTLLDMTVALRRALSDLRKTI